MKTKTLFFVSIAAAAALVSASCEQTKTTEPTATVSAAEQNKQLMNDYINYFNNRDWEKLKTLFAANYDYHPQEGIEGPDGLVAFLQPFANSFDAKVKIEDLVTDGDKVVYRGSVSGKHIADFQGMPPTNKDVNVSTIGICRIENGKVVEEWEVFEEMKMMQQLGAVPAPETK